MNSIGEFIKAVRNDLKMSQEAFGEKVGKTKGNVSAWENNVHEPSFSMIVKIYNLAGKRIPLPGIDGEKTLPSGVLPYEPRVKPHPTTEMMLKLMNSLGDTEKGIAYAAATVALSAFASASKNLPPPPPTIQRERAPVIVLSEWRKAKNPPLKPKKPRKTAIKK